MITFSVFTQSLGIAVNRSATQVASIFITAILGLYSLQVLAEFSLALTFAAILFAIVTTIQMGIQAEFSKRFYANHFNSLQNLFKSTLMTVIIIACVLILTIWVIPNPFASTGSIELAENAFLALKILTLSLPLVSALTTITFLLESIGKTKQVVFLRTGQILLQVGFVLLFIGLKRLELVSTNITANHLAAIYVLSDLVLLTIGSFLLYTNMKEKNINNSNKHELNTQTNSFLTVIKLGFPVMFGMIGQRVIFYSYANLVASLGVLQMSAFSIINSLTFFFQIPLLGVAHLMTIKIGKALGERNSLALRNTSIEFMKLFLLELGLITVLLYFVLPLMLGLMTDEVDALQLLRSLRTLIILYYIMNAALSFSMSALRGYSDTLMPQLIIISILAAGAGIGYIVSSEKLGFNGIILIFSLSGLAAAFWLYKRMLQIQKNELTVLTVNEAV